MKKVLIYTTLYLISIALIVSVFIPHGIHDLNPKFFWINEVIVFTSFLFLTKYMIYMIMSPWYDAAWGIWKAKNRAMVEAYQPKVSVIVPAWNEEVGVIATVQSILNSTYENIEIIIVNDGSTDNSDTIIREFVRTFETQQSLKTLVYQYKENGGKGTALNKGVAISTGDIIITIDADSLTERTAIGNFVKRFADPKVMAAVGNVKIGNTSSVIASIQYLEFLFSFYFKRADSVFGSIYIIGGAAGAFRKEVFDKLGLYNEKNITEDIELTMRIQKQGMKIVYVADAVVYTEGADDLKGLMKQRLRWKRGRLDTFIKYKKMFFSSGKIHNKFLTWFVLPFAVIGDTELVIEIPFILFLYITSFITRDYSAFLAALLIVTFVFFIQVFTPDKKFNRSNAYVLAPVGWLMFYLVTFIEINALFRSVHSLYTRKAIQWQSWKRSGISDMKK